MNIRPAFSFRLFLFAFFFLITIIDSKAQIDYFNSDDFWHKMSLKPLNYKATISTGDTAVIIASNRVFNDTDIRFLPDIYKGGIRYFVVYSRMGKWNVIPVTDLKTAVNYLPEKNKDWIIYTEGMGKLFTTAADRGMQMNAFYGVNVIMLDYPSIKAKWRRTRNYYFSKHNATIAYKDFAPVLDTIKMLRDKNLLGNQSINFFFHSMGNIVFEELVLHNKITQFNKDVWVNNLILNAACVQQRHHKRWLDKVNFAKRIYVLYNPHDFTLGGAYFMSKMNQLGMKVKRPLSNKATYINFEYLAGKRHSNFLNLIHYPPQPEAALRQYRVLFHGAKINVNDTAYFRVSHYKKIGWDILPD